MADHRAARKAAKRARAVGRRAERRAAAAEGSGVVDALTTTLAYRPRDNVQGQAADTHNDKDAGEEVTENITILAHRPKGSGSLPIPLTTQTPRL